MSSATEDEARTLDAGWDAEDSNEDEVDQAWDSLVPGARAAAPSNPPATEEVDGGWDDAPAGAQQATGGDGKRRPHRPRRVKTNDPLVSANPVLLPRPAEPSKKHQREHARKQRAYEAQVKQQRKVERKAQRAVELREEAAARLRQAEVDEQARLQRKQARERAEQERPARPARSAAKPSRPKRAETRQPGLKRDESSGAVSEAPGASVPARSLKRGLHPGVLVGLLALAAVVAFLLLRK